MMKLLIMPSPAVTVETSSKRFSKKSLCQGAVSGRTVTSRVNLKGDEEQKPSKTGQD